MSSNRPHPLLEQVPLTVSPFVSLPAATTLSYNYKTMPSNIPPSGLGIPTATDGAPAERPQTRFVTSNSGHSASPTEILESCRRLREYVTNLQQQAEREVRELEERFRNRDLAEKRRLAPGWLDRNERLLQPERVASAQQQPGPSSASQGQKHDGAEAHAEMDQGAQLDRAFGHLMLSDSTGGRQH